MRIAISGKSGCGNTTVSSLLAKRLGIPLVNFTFRQMAEERGMEFWEFCRLAGEDYSIDRELDRRQVEMAKAHDSAVLGSRLAIWMLSDADLKVYLYASDEERARRILRREGGRLEERLEETRRRDLNDHMRYMEIYGIDNDQYEDVADLVIDTSEKRPEEIVSIILRAL